MIRQTTTLPAWDLSDLYSGIQDPALQRDMDSALQAAQTFAARYRGRIAVPDLPAGRLAGALEEYERLLRQVSRPQAYAMLMFAADTRNPQRGALLQRAREFASTLEARLVFFDLEIGRIPKTLYAVIRDSAELLPYRHYLDRRRALAVHDLSESEEKILVETANTRGQAFARLFTEIHGRLRYRLEHDGRTQELSQPELLALLYHPQRELRCRAAGALTAGLRSQAHVCTFIYNTILHEKDVLDRLRRFPTPAASRHLANELDAEVVDTVTDVCVANYPTVARYYRLKRRLLDLDELTHYDRYAPIGGEDIEISFQDAADTVLNAFAAFSPRFADAAQQFFDRGWIDADLTEGKRGGAFCAGVAPDLHPYILLNYTGRPRDVMTLAHELGHGIHYLLSADHHLLDYHPVLPLAETASTFGEMLVFERLQRTLPSPEQRLRLLCGKIEDTIATVFRQVAMYRFEESAHLARRNQGEIPTDKLDELWQRTQQEMFGDALRLGEDHASWWMYIPHIIESPFYVYAYAFGELLVLSLYARYQDEGSAFMPRYLELLKAGGSRAPAELIADLGFDVRERNFWQAGCDLVAQRVEQAEALAVSQG